MCKDCGCEEGNERILAAHEHTHVHADGTVHTHHHGEHAHPHDHEHRQVKLEQNILAANDAIAIRNRAVFTEKGITAINLISSPGTGKTMLLEKTLEALAGELPCAVITGDQQTARDADRLRDKGAPVYQIETRSSCHLNAEQIEHAMTHVLESDTRLLFIENVGNLVCPAAFDLGEQFKVALLSTTEGEDKPIKYPVIFSDAKVVVLTKTDLAPHLDWDAAACRRFIRQVQPGAVVYELSARTGDGMKAWLDYLRSLAG